MRVQIVHDKCDLFCPVPEPGDVAEKVRPVGPGSPWGHPDDPLTGQGLHRQEKDISAAMLEKQAQRMSDTECAQNM